MTDESDETAAAEEAGDEETPAEAEAEETDAEVEEEPDVAEPDDDDAVEEAAEGDDEVPGGIQEGDVIRLAYTAYASESGLLVDTTDPEVAEEEGVDEEGRTFEPRVVAIGRGHLFDAVEEAIIGNEPGDRGEVVVPAAEAFGEEDPDQVQTVSADKIPEDERYPGAHVDIDGRHGHVETIIGGRARVDFNHPLAGEDIEYEFEILEQIEERLELARGLLETYLDLDLEVWFQTDEVTVEAGEDEEPTSEEVESLYIEATPAMAMNQQWLFQKQEIAGQLIDQLDIDRVVVQEILESREQVLEDTQSLLAEEGIGEELGDVEELLEE